MDAVKSLRGAGLDVTLVREAAGDLRADAALLVASGDNKQVFAIEAKGRAPYPNELDAMSGLRDHLASHGVPTLLAPYVGESLAGALRTAGWSWIDVEGNFDLRSPSMLLRQRVPRGRPPRPATRLPQGTGSNAIIRALIKFVPGEEEEPRGRTLAAQAGVSQPRVTQVLQKLSELGLVTRTKDQAWVPDRSELLTRFLAEYRGPRGSEHAHYTLDDPLDVVLAAARSGVRIAVSADVGPDLIVPWRRPSTVILYASDDIDCRALGLVEAEGRHAANVLVRYPEDLSVFPEPMLVATVRGDEIPLADPVQQIWDLTDLGGADRLEAAGRLTAWLMERP